MSIIISCSLYFSRAQKTPTQLVAPGEINSGLINQTVLPVKKIKLGEGIVTEVCEDTIFNQTVLHVKQIKLGESIVTEV